MMRTISRDFQPHGDAEIAALQLALQCLAQILDLFFIHPQVAIARDPELRISDHLAPGKHVGDVGMDNRRQQAESHAVSGKLMR